MAPGMRDRREPPHVDPAAGAGHGVLLGLRG